ncbi:MalY/PatB family protein [Thermosyntropha sp.]|uniref:MalY/PatB family protein n=1 Tax=Thermosyntropha sp. TaxID=2740820 RepID=UPI0025F87AE8|nr:MalY/PatB family protein [Thermosyntropha sp.]MBO8158213.1 pyridoxal phosphate-dependent aminotransferase [Thermosyntropha sp.]
MPYDFDEIIDRKNTGSMKWDGVKDIFGEEDLLPMWVADMDFKAPEPVIDALIARAKQGIFGYNRKTDAYDEAVIKWFKRRHNLDLRREWLCFSPGVVTGLNLIVRAFTEEGDKIIIQPPVYYPFYHVIGDNKRIIIENNLLLKDERYYMDFDDLEDKVKDKKAKMLFLCSPHNPVGRVWKKEELIRLGEICLKNDVIVVADEIHCDLVYSGYKHIPFASLSPELARKSITTVSPSKTFNLAGLQTSVVIIPDSEYRACYKKMLNIHRASHINTFGMVALEAAYNYGEEYLDQLLSYLEGNLNFLISYIEENMPQIKVIKPEGTYLVWLDFRSVCADYEELNQIMIKKAKLALDPGYWFGEAGKRFMRINIACPRTILEEGLRRIREAFK